MTTLRRLIGLVTLLIGGVVISATMGLFEPNAQWSGLLDAVDVARRVAANWELPTVSAGQIGAVGVALALSGAILVAYPRRRLAGEKPSAAPPTSRALASPGSAQMPSVPRQLDQIDREFLPAALEILETPPSPISMAAIWLICAAFFAALCFLYFGKLDIHAVAPGRIQPSGRSKVVQPLEPGRVVSISVDNGRVVAAGEVLLELDPTETSADKDSLARDLESFLAEAARRRVAVDVLRAGSFAITQIPFGSEVSEEIRRRETEVLASELGELSANVASIAAQIEERRATLKRLTASIEARARLLALTGERVKMRTDLTDVGALSRALVIDSLQQHELQTITQASEQGQLTETEASLKTLQRKSEETISHFIADQTQKLIDAERKSDRIRQDLIKARTKNERTAIRSPIAGVVQQLSLTTVGQVVTSGQSLLTIVPLNSELEIEARIANLDIGFVTVGQPAVVKIETFPFTRYGTLSGRVTKLSQDAVDEREARMLSDPNSAVRPQSLGSQQANSGQNLVFPATIALEKWALDVDGKEIALTPGMAVTVEILTGQRRALDYILAPLREVASNAVKER